MKEQYWFMLLLLCYSAECQHIGLLFISNSGCSFASCVRKSLNLYVTDSPVILPCDNLTPINTISVTGNYSYCHNKDLLVNQHNSFYTLDYDSSFDGTTICCYNHDIEACGVCYDLTVYYAPTNQEFLRGPVYFFNQPYTAHCDSEGNPPPVCRWFRESLVPIDSDYMYEFVDDGSGKDVLFDNLVPITDDVIFDNNGCTVHFPRLERIHSGHYFCIATNSLGRGIAGLPTIIFTPCRSQTTDVVIGGSSNVKAVFNETVRLTCTVSPASDLTIIQFTFNNTIYRDANYINVSYPNGITVNSVYHNDNCSVESSLIIENFSQHFIGEYSCSSFIFGNSRVVGNNVTFNVSTQEKEVTERECSVSMISGRIGYNRKRRRTKLILSSNGDLKVSYKCKLDDRKFKNCKSSMIWRNLKRGKHTITVRAFCTNDEGNRFSTVKKKFNFRIRL